MRIRGIKSEFYDGLSEREKRQIWDIATLVIVFLVLLVVALLGWLPYL